MPATSIRLDRDGDLAVLTLVPPEGKPPTLDYETLEAIDGAVAELEVRPPRLLILSAESERFFCVGANLNVLKTITAETIGNWVRRGHDVINRLEDLPFPTIARINGYAMGGGLELAMGCDLIVAHDTAKLGQSEAKLGFIPGWGGTRRLAQRVGEATARKLFFRGDVLGASEAREAGLVDFVDSAEGVEAFLKETLELVCGNSAYALGTFKRILSKEQREARDRNREEEAEQSRGCLEDPDTIARIEAFLNK